ncbi:MAG: iron-sulfur cluster loop [Thermodesulfobacteriota bacterium]
MTKKEKQVMEEFKKLEGKVKPYDLFPTKGCKKAGEFVKDLKRHPHAFVFGCILDRQVKAETAWLAPYKLSKRIGSFSIKKLKTLSNKDWEKHLKNPTSLHRYTNTMANCLFEAVKRIDEEYDGDASKIWESNLRSGDIVNRFEDFKGIGPKISTMAVNILRGTFGIKMADHKGIDISADVHVRRVFYRLGLIESDPEKNEEMAIYESILKARSMNAEFPGIIDAPTWYIGREWCDAQTPDCKNCPMDTLCAKQGVN